MSKSKEVWDDASSSTQKRNYNQIYNGNGQNYKTKLHIQIPHNICQSQVNTTIINQNRDDPIRTERDT